MTKEEAKEIFLNRGYIEVEGGTVYDADKWRESCRVISEWLEQEPCYEFDFVQPHKKVSVNLDVCKMREATQEEREGIEHYIDSIEEQCEDVISRQSVLDNSWEITYSDSTSERVVSVKDIESLPPVTVKKTKINYCKEVDSTKYSKLTIEALEQTRWIPVTERLPEENGWYQCTVILNDLPRTMDLFYKNGKWLDNRRIDMFDTYDIYGYGNTTEKHKLSYQELISEFEWDQVVIAWKLLSEPYKTESAEEIHKLDEIINLYKKET